MKILFAAPENAWGGFLHLIRNELPEHEFKATGSFNIDSLIGYDALIPTMSPITASVIGDCDRLKLIQQCGSGLEGVDIAAAEKRGIWVANVPTDISGNADSVAELGIYFIIGLSRSAPAMADSLAACRMGEPQGRALKGRTVGIIGLGGIGKALIARLRPFGVRLIGLKRNAPLSAQTELGLDWVGGSKDLQKFLGSADYVVLCLPHTRESHHLINVDSFSQMKTNAFLINLSRGGLVDRDALEKALKSGMIAGAGLDVFWQEPPDPDDPIFQYNVMATPHVAGSTDVSMQGIVRVAAENIRRLARNEKPLYCQT